MRAFASLVCGYIFGWGLFISGMVRPDKVLAFLDVFSIPSGHWDPSLAVVMAAALVVAAFGYALAQRRTPMFEPQNQWPTQGLIHRPLVIGSALFGIGWGLVGLCPGPAIENLATFSPSVTIFVAAMAVGMFGHDLWQSRAASPASQPLVPAASPADG
jgi:uncharacterized protein